MNCKVLIHQNLVTQNILFLVTQGVGGFLLDLRMSFQNVPEMQVRTRLTVGYVEYFAIKQKTSGTQGYLRPNPEIYLIS